MPSFDDQKQENKSPLSSNDAAAKTNQEKATFQLQDNRPEAIAQRKLQNNINGSAPVTQQKALQDKINNSAPVVAQREEIQKITAGTIQRVENKTGMPDQLKSGIENLSGMSMNDVKVHYNSPKPATLQAHAYAQGSNIHLGPGQEKHLPHEAWHVVQQKQGRVKPTLQMKKGVHINDDKGLEKEADVMGQKAVTSKTEEGAKIQLKSADASTVQRVGEVMQMSWWEKVGDDIIKREGDKPGGYRLVRGVKATDGSGESVFESKEQKSANSEKPKTYAEELGLLPEDGTGEEFTVDAKLVRYSQDSIGKVFSDGKTISSVAAALGRGTTKYTDFPPIRVFMSSDKRLVTLDNRRLWCCKEAGKSIRCEWATMKQIEHDAFKFTSGKGHKGLTTIEVRT